MLFLSGVNLEIGKRLVGYCPKSAIKGVKEGRFHLCCLVESRLER